MSSPSVAARSAGGIFALGAAAAAVLLPVLPHRTLPLTLIVLVDGLVGLLCYLLPWDRWRREATLALALPTFGVVALAEANGLLPPRSVTLLYVLAFVWVGAYHRPGRALALIPLAVASYAATVRVHGEGPPPNVGSLAMLAVVLVLVAETIARSHERLRESVSHFRFLAEHGTDVVTRVGADGVIQYASPSVRQLLGWDPHEMVGTYAPTYRHPDDDVPAEHAMERPGEAVAVVRRLRRKDGSWVWVESVARAVVGPDGRQEIVSTARDVTQRRELQAELETLATRDPLTRALNRCVLEERLGEALQDGAPVALAFVDLDGFKRVNDEHGHHVGDELLVEVARRLRTVSRAEDLVARYGGDEFVLVVRGLPGEEDLEALARRVDEELSKPYRLSAVTARVGASVGVALAVPGTTPDELLREADLRMYASKSDRRPPGAPGPPEASGPFALPV